MGYPGYYVGAVAGQGPQKKAAGSAGQQGLNDRAEPFFPTTREGNYGGSFNYARGPHAKGVGGHTKGVSKGAARTHSQVFPKTGAHAHPKIAKSAHPAPKAPAALSSQAPQLLPPGGAVNKTQTENNQAPTGATSLPLTLPAGTEDTSKYEKRSRVCSGSRTPCFTLCSGSRTPCFSNDSFLFLIAQVHGHPRDELRGKLQRFLPGIDGSRRSRNRRRCDRRKNEDVGQLVGMFVVFLPRCSHVSMRTPVLSSQADASILRLLCSLLSSSKKIVSPST